MIEARFENGASMGLADVDMNSANQAAQDALMSCLPTDRHPRQPVRTTIIRRDGACALCGSATERVTFRGMVLVELSIGAPTQVCLVCADDVWRAYKGVKLE